MTFGSLHHNVNVSSCFCVHQQLLRGIGKIVFCADVAHRCASERVQIYHLAQMCVTVYTSVLFIGPHLFLSCCFAGVFCFI